MTAGGDVKSARRVFEILDDFEVKRRPQRLSEIARTLGIPISSCVALLSTLVESDILFYDCLSRSYMPTRRLKDLGRWIDEDDRLQQRAIYWARRLAWSLGTPTAVTRRTGLYLEWLYTRSVAEMGPGELRPLCQTVNGLASLSLLTDTEVGEIAAAHNEQFGIHNKVDVSVLLQRIRLVRSAGYVSEPTTMVPGAAAICFALRDPDGEEILLTVQVPASELRARERRIVEAVRRLVANHAPASTH